jgi:hypothetical protein
MSCECHGSVRYLCSIPSSKKVNGTISFIGTDVCGMAPSCSDPYRCFFVRWRVNFPVARSTIVCACHSDILHIHGHHRSFTCSHDAGYLPPSTDRIRPPSGRDHHLRLSSTWSYRSSRLCHLAHREFFQTTASSARRPTGSFPRVTVDGGDHLRHMRLHRVRVVVFGLHVACFCYARSPVRRAADPIPVHSRFLGPYFPKRGLTTTSVEAPCILICCPQGVYANLTIALSNTFDSSFFKIYGSVYSILTLTLWIIVAFRTAQLVLTAEIFEAPCLEDTDMARRAIHETD